MAMDMFLEIEGVKGESQASGHKEQIDVLAWSWGLSNSASAHSGTGGGAGKANFQDISVTKYLDKSTPALMGLCSKGDHVDKAKIHVRKAGGTQLEYLTYELEQVFVTSVSTGGSGGEDRLTENISLNFRKFKVTYQQQDAKGGKVGGPVDFGYDIAAVDKT